VTDVEEEDTMSPVGSVAAWRGEGVRSGSEGERNKEGVGETGCGKGGKSKTGSSTLTPGSVASWRGVGGGGGWGENVEDRVAMRSGKGGKSGGGASNMTPPGSVGSLGGEGMGDGEWV